MLSLIVSEDITLRNYREEDAAILFRVVHQNRLHLRPWLVWVDGTQKEAHSLEYIRAAANEQYAQKSIAFGIFQDGELIGGIGMHEWDHVLRKAKMGYWLVKQEEGKGTLMRCAQVFISYLFQRLQLNKIELQYLPANTRSAATAKRLGFAVEGVLRDHYLMNGTFHDLVIAGLLKRDWNTG
jgi:ribosomal-protein-serine acetyltransferase